MIAKSSVRVLTFAAALVAPLLIGGPTDAALREWRQPVVLKGDPAEEAKEHDRLFAALAAAKDAVEAGTLATEIWDLWFHAPSTEADTLMTQAMEMRSAHDYSNALFVLDQLVAVAPDWAEAWNQRATLRYMVRDFAGSLADIDRTLALEPKHFGALSGQAIILMHQGDMDGGQTALRKAVEIDPFLSDRALLMDPPKEGQDI